MNPGDVVAARFEIESLTGTGEELRPVPDKPYIPADVWISGTVRP